LFEDRRGEGKREDFFYESSLVLEMVWGDGKDVKRGDVLERKWGCGVGFL